MVIWLIKSAYVDLLNLNFTYATFSDYYDLSKNCVFRLLIPNFGSQYFLDQHSS
jgi:hypothetical protein